MRTKRPDASFCLLTGDHIEALPFKAGSVIFREGHEARELFVIRSGEVRIQIGNRTITELGADRIFGEMALIDNEPSSATAIAVTDTELVPYQKSSSCFLSADPSFCSQRLACFGPTAAENQQDVWLSGLKGCIRADIQTAATDRSSLGDFNASFNGDAMRCPLATRPWQHICAKRHAA
jgi:CRP/FNR family cyclic AMP-dependent transcriptional regulator